MNGIIYIVTNDVNDYVYIGKTYTSLETRWKRHLSDAYRQDRSHNKFHEAIVSIGANHFNIRALAIYKDGELEKQESYYINKYNSYYNGYNSTLGGEGTKTIEFSKSDIDTIIELYRNGMSIRNISKEYCVSAYTISNILKNNGITVEKQSKSAVACYNKNGEYFEFDSIMKAANALGISREDKTQLRNFYNGVNKSCRTGSICHKYIWTYI